MYLLETSYKDISKLKVEEILKVGVDIVHGPIEESDLIEIGKVVELYAA